MSIKDQHIVQLTSGGFVGSEINIEFQGSINDCKNFLQKKAEQLEAEGNFYGVFTDDNKLTLEIFRKVDNKITEDKYMIHKAI